MSINGVNSVHKHVNCGVPWGSILGPLLFVIYINDLPNSSSKFKFVLYSDDIALQYRGSNMYNMIQDMTNELHKVISWFNSNKHPLNADILTFIIFHSHQKQCSLSKHIVFDDKNNWYSSSSVLMSLILLISYSTLILPYLAYCCITWGYAYQSHIK